MNERHEGSAELLMPRGNAAELLELVEGQRSTLSLEAAVEAAMPAVRGAGAAGGASVGRGAGAAEPCAMSGVPASVTPPPASGRRKAAVAAVP